MADSLWEERGAILAANALDIDAARGHIAEVMLDRLALTEDRIAGMAEGVRQVTALSDPVGRTLRTVERPNGITIRKVSVPMGVIAIIYESRPNVTSDAAALALKSGNACVLRGGKEAFRSANAIVEALRRGLERAGLPGALVSLVQDTTRESARELMTAVVEGGTAKKLSGLSYTAAGKTGSAEYNDQGDSHAWFTGFAPAQDPEICVTIIVEGAGSGGDYAVPIARRIFDAYFSREK